MMPSLEKVSRPIAFALAGIAIGIGFSPAMAQQAARPQGAAPFDPSQSTSVLRPKARSRVKVNSLNYLGGHGQALAADLYFDPSATRPRPILILASGAGDARTWGAFKDLARLAVERGFTALIPVKRFERGLEGIQTGHEDTLALLRQLPTLAPPKADGSRACLWTFSAGGSTLTAALAPGAPRLACTINFYPMLSLSAYGAGEKWLGQYSPAHLLAQAKSVPPTLVLRAGKDQPRINNAIDEFAGKAFAANAPVTIVNLPDAQHAFDWFDNTDWSRAAIEQSFAWAREKTAAAH